MVNRPPVCWLGNQHGKLREDNMDHLKDLQAEQAYTVRVQQLLLALIEQARVISGSHLAVSYTHLTLPTILRV